MLKTLIKKQLLALSAAVTMDRKHGKKRSKGAVAGFCVLFIFMFISLCMAFLGMSEAIEIATLPDRAWLYMTLMGMIALVLSIIGSVFSTYATIYKAKDNELMLSLPVPPANLLISKLFSVYLTALLFSAIVMIPALINYWTSGQGGAASAVSLR